MPNDRNNSSQRSLQNLSNFEPLTCQKSHTTLPAIRSTMTSLVYLKNLMEMIKIKHTIFSLPFGLLGAMATNRSRPTIGKVALILLAITTARTAAMTFNRLIDQDIDINNPRTKDRALPTGRVNRASAICLLGISIVLFGDITGRLGVLPWKLAPITLLIILSYSLCKRFTMLSHIILGLSLAIAPLGASIAVNETVNPPIWFLAIGVLAWSAGFDIIYALQDVEFDQKYQLHSIPSRIGVAGALQISRGMHILASSAWAIFNYKVGASFLPWTAWSIVTIILAREHWIVRRGNLECIDYVFFTLNSMVGIIFFLGHAMEWTLVRLKI